MKKVLQQSMAKLALISFLILPTLSVGAVAAGYKHMDYDMIIESTTPIHKALSRNDQMYSYKTVLNRPLLRIPVSKPIKNNELLEKHKPSFFELATLFNDKLQSWSDKLSRPKRNSHNEVARSASKKCSLT